MSCRCTRPVMKRIEDLCFRQIAYSKCREGIFKKAAELSVFSDTDIGLLLFSPTVKPNISYLSSLQNAKLLENEASTSKLKDAEVSAVEVKDSDFTTEESVNSKRKRNKSEDDEKEEAGSSAVEVPCPTPHLNISFLKTQTNWNLQKA
ncbi:hypothetical protein PVK06_044432 [Gossypium arboreum]|uniref:MADS-box domain-containing protein n=1 Tax=Gossypium arboreum TaxID=29729 RepID=A0ABR0MR65_GOSAR|nr:hypothetical protein PVK06_044432 [Gossypium arboreum]